MSYKFSQIDPRSLQSFDRGTPVRFDYVSGKQVKHVTGFFDKLLQEAILIGNESYMEHGRMNVSNKKEYDFDKINNLEAKVFVSGMPDKIVGF